MTRPRDSDGGGAPDTQESRDEPAPEVLAPQNLSMRCHLVQLNWTQTQFEALKRSIMEFGNDIMHINSLRGLSVTRKSLVAYWNQLVWFFYGEGNATSNRLESQADSPRFNRFCIERGLAEDFRETDEEESGFRPSRRRATPSENKKWPGVSIMETCFDLSASTAGHRELLIPVIGLRALKYVEYRALVPLILKANPGVEIAYSDMQLLWDAIIHKVYCFVCACEREAKAVESMAIDGYTEEQYVQLAREVCVVPELTLGAKHSLDQGNSEDDSDASDQSPSEQQKKRKRRGKRAHRLEPGPKSRRTAQVTAVPHSTSAISVPPPRAIAGLKKPAAPPRSSVESQEQNTEPELSSGQGRKSGLGPRMMQTKRRGEGDLRFEADWQDETS